MRVVRKQKSTDSTWGMFVLQQATDGSFGAAFVFTIFLFYGTAAMSNFCCDGSGIPGWLLVQNSESVWRAFRWL